MNCENIYYGQGLLHLSLIIKFLYLNPRPRRFGVEDFFKQTWDADKRRNAGKRRNAETNPPAPNSRGHPLSVKGAQEKRWECGKEETPGAEKEWMGHIISVIYSGGCLSLQ